MEMNINCRNSFLKQTPNPGGNALPFPGDIKGLYTKSSAFYNTVSLVHVVLPVLAWDNCMVRPLLLRNLMSKGRDEVER